MVSPWSVKSKTSTCLWSKDSFPQSSLLMTMLPFSLLEEDDSFPSTHPFFGFRFCVINLVSTPKLLSLISVACPMDTRKAHTVPFNELFHHLWEFLAPSVHTLLCNPVGPRQFCALPSECLALWQCQQMNTYVRHASYVVNLPGAQVTTYQHLFCHCWKSCTVSLFMVLHILHTPSPIGSEFSLVQHTPHTQKSKHTHTSKSAMVPADHPSLI